jgi:predicted nucleic acid-binding protein
MTTTNAAFLIIADSSALVSLLHPDDANHEKANALVESLERTTGKVLIPTEVFTETINVIGRNLGHKLAILAAGELMASETFYTDSSNHNILASSLNLFAKQPESVSLTDCLVMATADFYGTDTIFGFDDTFSRNGYHLPRS